MFLESKTIPETKGREKQEEQEYPAPHPAESQTHHSLSPAVPSQTNMFAHPLLGDQDLALEPVGAPPTPDAHKYRTSHN